MEDFDALCYKMVEVERRQFSVEAVGGDVEVAKAEITLHLKQFLSLDSLDALWKALLRKDSTTEVDSQGNGKRISDLDRKADIYRLLAGYRIISNYHFSLGISLRYRHGAVVG